MKSLAKLKNHPSIIICIPLIVYYNTVGLVRSHDKANDKSQHPEDFDKRVFGRMHLIQSSDWSSFQKTLHEFITVFVGRQFSVF